MLFTVFRIPSEALCNMRPCLVRTYGRQTYIQQDWGCKPAAIYLTKEAIWVHSHLAKLQASKVSKISKQFSSIILSLSLLIKPPFSAENNKFCFLGYKFFHIKDVINTGLTILTTAKSATTFLHITKSCEETNINNPTLLTVSWSNGPQTWPQCYKQWGKE